MTSKKQSLKTARLQAYFTRDKQNKLALKSAKMLGNVRVTNGNQTATAKRGEYDAVRDVAKLFDNVRVTDGQNYITGGYGEINRKTGESQVLPTAKMQGTKIGKKRVKIMIAPLRNNKMSKKSII